MKYTSVRIETEAIPVGFFEALLATTAIPEQPGAACVPTAQEHRLADLVHFADALIAATIVMGRDRLLAKPEADRWTSGLEQLEHDLPAIQIQGYASLLAILGMVPDAVTGLAQQLGAALLGSAAQHGSDS